MPKWHCIDREKKKPASPSDHPVVICALMQQMVLVSQKAEAVSVTLRASHILFYGLSVGKPEGAVQSHSLIGEHMSRPICHWLLWEWHQRWPLDPDWRRNASSIVFHYKRGERAWTPDGYVENGKIGKLEKALRPVFDPECFSFFAGGVYEISIWPIIKAFVISPCFPWPFRKAITEDKTGIILPTCMPATHFKRLSPFVSSWCVPACQFGCVWISLECICRVSNKGTNCCVSAFGMPQNRLDTNVSYRSESTTVFIQELSAWGCRRSAHTQ